MDEITRQIIADAIAADDEARAAYEAPSSVLVRRDAGKLIYKRTENALCEPAPVFTEAQFEELNGFADDVGATCGKLERRIKDLENEVLLLRALAAKKIK
jgi:hypothetical protein